ncbi:MAG: type II toxin-antitoxin system RelE/ParE family toxin [Stellaceae bacterium]
MTLVVKYDIRETWLDLLGRSSGSEPPAGISRTFRKAFKSVCDAQGLTIVAEDQTPDIAKPLKGLGSGVFELALRYRGDAYRVVYALHLGAEIWVVHAFQKKSKTGIGTPKAEIDLIRQRLRRASASRE